MNNLFVPYDNSFKLKQVGFNEHCFGFYSEKKELIFHQNPKAFYTKNKDVAFNASIFNILSKKKYDVCAAPLYSQVIDWFEDVHDIKISPLFLRKLNSYVFILETKAEGLHLVNYLEYPKYNTKYEAINKGIEEAFNFIKK